MDQPHVPRKSMESSSQFGCLAPDIRQLRWRRRGKLQRGTSSRKARIEPREYRNPVTGEAVLPSSGAWEYLFPRAIDSESPKRVRYLGHIYVQDSVDRRTPRSRAYRKSRRAAAGLAGRDRQVTRGRKTRPGVMTVRITNWSV